MAATVAATAAAVAVAVNVLKPKNWVVSYTELQSSQMLRVHEAYRKYVRGDPNSNVLAMKDSKTPQWEPRRHVFDIHHWNGELKKYTVLHGIAIPSDCSCVQN